MTTKRITLEMDAFEKLERAKRTSAESFSAVVRRAAWPERQLTAGRLLAIMRRRMTTREGIVNEATLDRLDEHQRKPRRSPSRW